MAFASDSTTVPTVQAGLLHLPTLDRRAIGRDGWARARELAAQLGGEIRDHVAAGMRQAWAAARGLLQADQPTQSRSVDHPDHTGVVPPLLPFPAPLPPLSAALSRRRAIFGAVAVDEPDTAAEARRIHLRRQLAQAAEHGVALLASLGLPRLVDPGFVPLDPVAIGDALDRTIAALDALDGDSEAEPWLGWTGAAIGAAVLGDTLDREGEDLDEPWLGWGAGSQLRLTANEDDGFDPLDRGEAVNEDGDDLDRGERDTADDEAWLGWPEDLRAEAHPLTVLSEIDAEHDPADLGAQRMPWRDGSAVVGEVAYA